MTLSANIRQQRKKAGLTQIQLAEKLGISIATLRRWEAGETAPTGTKIFDLAQQLGVSPDSIVASNDNGSHESINDSDGQTGHQSLPRENGMLVFDGGGIRIELPPTDRGYELFDKLVDNFLKKDALRNEAVD